MLIIIIFLIFLCGCTNYQHVRVIKLDEEPNNFIIITEEEMNNYPSLKKAIETNDSVQTPYKEFTELHELFEDIRNFKYLDDYYYILFGSY